MTNKTDDLTYIDKLDRLFESKTDDLTFFKYLDELFISPRGKAYLLTELKQTNLKQLVIDRVPSRVTKAKIKNLKFNYYDNSSDWDSIFRAIITDQITRLTPPSSNETELPEYKKLLEARENNEDFEMQLTERICGDNKKYPYKSGSDIEEFFFNLGCPNSDIPFEYYEFGSSEHDWVAAQLRIFEVKEIHRIIKEGLFKEKYFVKKAEADGKDYKEVLETAQKDFQEWIEESTQPEESVDMNYLLNLNINTELLHNKRPQTSDEELNDLVDTAVDYFKKPGRKNKRTALENIWGAFERIKTYHGENKKKSSSQLIDQISSILNSELDIEFKHLTKIGNNYGIRHKETNQRKIDDSKIIDYLFYRAYNLIYLCLHKLNDKE